ncbi:MAG: carbohydrate-binding family 9-like protein [Thermodesulfobacteriota bacterium]
MANLPVYTIHRTDNRPELKGQWGGEVWGNAPFLEIAAFRPESGTHRPVTRVKILSNPEGLFGLFQVQDRFVRCVRTGFQSEVYKDSCVEFFVQPRPDSGYFNFEFNCGGAALMYYITDPRRTPDGFRAFTKLTPGEGGSVDIYASLPPIVEPELTRETCWHLEFYIPFALLRKYAGDFSVDPGTCWRANFYKCGDETSRPHWAAWSPVDELNFHLPRCFGELRFAP